MSRLTATVRFVSLFSAALCLSLLSGCSGGKGKPTKANFDAIQTGATEAEVDALMGPPTGSQELPPVVGDVLDKIPPVGGMDIGGAMKSAVPVKMKYWTEGDTGFRVEFSKDGKMVSKGSGKASDIKKDAK